MADTTVPHADLDIQIGIYRGLGHRMNEMARKLNVSRKTIWEHEKSPAAPYIALVATWAKAAAADTLQQEIQKADVKRRINEKAYKTVDKALTGALQKATKTTDVTAVHLDAAKVALDRTEGKPLDRKSIMSQHEERITIDGHVDVDVLDLDGVVAEARRLNALRRQITGVTLDHIPEAELVESSANAI